MTMYMIIDGQWGSTGKGLLAGYLAMKREPIAAINNFGPNAGHTFVNGNVTVMTTILPTALVAPTVRDLFIGPGAVINPETLAREMAVYEQYLQGKHVFVHEAAAIVSPNHIATEGKMLQRISSTCKGTAAAMCGKVMREPGAIARYCSSLPVSVIGPKEWEERIMNAVSDGDVQIESAQGLELGINTGGFYPYCTSRDITVPQVLADCGIPWCHGKNVSVYVSMRAHPIRVGDVYEDGIKIGTSGPVYDDQEELSWEELGQPAEKTTVTGKIRRVFTFSWQGYTKMLRYLSPDGIFLNFVNYLDHHPRFGSGFTGAMINQMETLATFEGFKTPLVKWIGTGADFSDVHERPSVEEAY